ncbi:MAG: hypothetical protein PVG14_08955 [Anaerolineales bacterium]
MPACILLIDHIWLTPGASWDRPGAGMVAQINQHTTLVNEPPLKAGCASGGAR